MTFKRLSTQPVIGKCCTVNLHFQFANSGNVQVIYFPHINFLGLMEDYMEQLNEGGIEFHVCFVELCPSCSIARDNAYYSTREAKYMECGLECRHVVEVEKFGVHLLYKKADEEELITFRPEENMGVGVFHGDLDRSVEVVNASATTSKRKCDDLNNNNDYDAAVAGPSGSGGFDDQEEEDHLNIKRLRSE